jgi:hypothetical protein
LFFLLLLFKHAFIPLWTVRRGAKSPASRRCRSTVERALLVEFLSKLCYSCDINYMRFPTAVDGDVGRAQGSREPRDDEKETPVSFR